MKLNKLLFLLLLSTLFYGCAKDVLLKEQLEEKKVSRVGAVRLYASADDAIGKKQIAAIRQEYGINTPFQFYTKKPEKGLTQEEEEFYRDCYKMLSSLDKLRWFDDKINISPNGNYWIGSRYDRAGRILFDCAVMWNEMSCITDYYVNLDGANFLSDYIDFWCDASSFSWKEMGTLIDNGNSYRGDIQGNLIYYSPIGMQCDITILY